MLDFSATSDQIGKPSNGADLRLGLATAPILFASLNNAHLQSLIKTPPKQSEEREMMITEAVLTVRNSDGLHQTKELAKWYAQKALNALDHFPESPAKQSLQSLANSVTDREK